MSNTNDGTSGSASERGRDHDGERGVRVPGGEHDDRVTGAEASWSSAEHHGYAAAAPSAPSHRPNDPEATTRAHGGTEDATGSAPTRAYPTGTFGSVAPSWRQDTTQGFAAPARGTAATAATATHAEASYEGDRGSAGTAPFGTAATEGAQQAGQAQPGPQAPYAGHPQPYSHPQQTATRPERRRSSAGTVLGAALVALLVGGGAGWGASTLALQQQGGAQASSSSTSPQSITINDTSDVSRISAVASNLSTSTVTINATNGQASSTGSGIVISDDGYIVTNAHVVTLDGQSANSKLVVERSDGTLESAKIIGADYTADVAVVKVDDANGLTPVTFADSDRLNVGETTIAIGSPLGLNASVTSGIVSALGRSITVSSSDPRASKGSIAIPVIQTDAAVNPGNSGGALVNDKGELIGMNVAIASASQGQASSSEQSGSIGLGFALPSNYVKRLAFDIMNNGTTSHGLLGATATNATTQPDAATAITGAKVGEVTQGGGAAAAGIRTGDIITRINDTRITNSIDLQARVREYAASTKVQVTVYRDGRTQTLEVTLGDLGAPSQ